MKRAIDYWKRKKLKYQALKEELQFFAFLLAILVTGSTTILKVIHRSNLRYVVFDRDICLISIVFILLFILFGFSLRRVIKKWKRKK